MKISEVTGLPEVPNKYFFRVVVRPYTGYHGTRAVVYLQLRKRVFKVFSKRIASTELVDYFEAGKRDIETIKNIMPKMAEKLWDACLKRITAQEAQRDFKKNFVGDYPPKKLETK